MPTPRRHVHPAARQAAYRARCAAARKQEQAAKGLPALPAVATLPGWRRWNAVAQQVAQLLKTAVEEMEAYADERSEAWEDSDRGGDFRERLEMWEQALASTEELLLDAGEEASEPDRTKD